METDTTVLSDENAKIEAIIRYIMYYQNILHLSYDERKYSRFMLGTNSKLCGNYLNRIRGIIDVVSNAKPVVYSYYQNISQLCYILNGNMVEYRLQVSRLIHEVEVQINYLIEYTQTLRRYTKYPADVSNLKVNSCSFYQYLIGDDRIQIKELTKVYKIVGIDFDLDIIELRSYLYRQLPRFRQIDLFVRSKEPSVLDHLTRAVRQIVAAFQLDKDMTYPHGDVKRHHDLAKLIKDESRIRKLYNSQLEMGKIYYNKILVVPVEVDMTNDYFDSISGNAYLHHEQRYLVSQLNTTKLDFTGTRALDLDDVGEYSNSPDNQLYIQGSRLETINLDDIRSSIAPQNRVLDGDNKGMVMQSEQIAQLDEQVESILDLLDVSAAEREYLRERLRTAGLYGRYAYLQRLQRVHQLINGIKKLKHDRTALSAIFSSETDHEKLFGLFQNLNANTKAIIDLTMQFNTLTGHYTDEYYHAVSLHQLFEDYDRNNLVHMIMQRAGEISRSMGIQEDELKRILHKQLYSTDSATDAVEGLVFNELDSQHDGDEWTEYINAVKSFWAANNVTPSDKEAIQDGLFYNYVASEFAFLSGYYYDKMKRHVLNGEYVCHVGFIDGALDYFRAGPEHPLFRGYYDEYNDLGLGAAINRYRTLRYDDDVFHEKFSAPVYSKAEALRLEEVVIGSQLNENEALTKALVYWYDDGPNEVKFSVMVLANTRAMAGSGHTPKRKGCC